MKYLFLDIDGVLNDHTPSSSGYCGLKPECVNNLNAILKHHPDVRIVISSAWRYMITRQTTTLKGFECLLLSHGVDCKGRVIGHTAEDTDWYEPRIDQILRWLEDNDPDCDDWIAIDDLPLSHKNAYQTNGTTGLTTADVNAILR